ncbi:16282_t:CDS:2, partial [Funneliformis geosporum]
GGHNLKTDCQTFANGFNKISGLRDIKEELKKCTSKSEYDAKKNNYIRQCEEALTGLSNNTSSSYIFVQELKELELEINQITQKMEENKKKAMSETDPVKKAVLIQSIEEDGLLLQQKYKKKQELANKFNFDPKKKVDNLIESMKKAIKKGKKKRTDGSGGGNHKNPNSSDANSSDSEDDYSSDDSNNGNGGGKLKNKLGEYTKELEKIPEPRELTDAEQENVEKESKQKEKMQLLVVLFLAGIGYYFFIYLNNKREEAKKEINLFVRKIKKVIKEKAEIEQEKPKKARGNAKKEIEDFAKIELQKKIREFNKKIDKTSAGELSSVINETNDFIIDIKVKRQGLH